MIDSAAPSDIAGLLLLSAAGIVIYALLALISHLVLRRWHERAPGKENEWWTERSLPKRSTF